MEHSIRVAFGSDCLEPLKVRGDPSRLLQALTNVLSNATRYTDAGGSIFVAVSRATLGDHSTVCISVRDTGRGIEPALLQSIFGMFVQGRDPLNRPAAGLGVGLALARSIIELHHGTIEAASDGPDQGSTFSLLLPNSGPDTAEVVGRDDDLSLLLAGENADAEARRWR